MALFGERRTKEMPMVVEVRQARLHSVEKLY
jgi:hypothetical protein